MTADVSTDGRGHCDQTSFSVLQVIGSSALRDGGPARVARRLNASLRRRGCKTALLSTDTDGYGRLDVSTSAPREEDGAVIWYCRQSRPHSLQNSWQLLARLVRLSRDANIIHVHGVYRAHTIYVLAISQITGIPYVLQPHGTLEPYQQSKGRLHKKLYNLLVGDRVIAGATAIICASVPEALNIQQQYPSARTCVTPLGMDVVPALDDVDVPDLPQQWRCAAREDRVVFLGRLASKKRPDLLMEAWNNVHAADAQLLVVGPDEDWSKDQLRALLSPHGMPSVSFIDEVDAGAAQAILGLSAIFVLPSENENFAVAVIEAMGKGAAVITTEQTAASTYVKRARSGIVLESPDARQLAVALTDLLNNPIECRLSGERGAKYAKENLSWDRTAAQSIEIYEAILTGEEVGTQMGRSAESSGT